MSNKKKYQFVVSDESVNAYGFRILTDGINLEHFLKNPVGFWNHDSSVPPVCKWSNLRKENGKLIGDCEVDTASELGKELARKIDDGYVNATSVWFDPKTFSDEAKYMLAGQTRETVVSSDLLEISLVGLPGNYNAVRLKLKGGGFIALNAETKNEDIETIVPRINSANKNSSNMTPEQKAALGLSADATDKQVTDAIEALKLKANSAAPVETPAPAAEAPVTLSNTEKTELESLRKERVTTLINQAKADKRIGDDEVDSYTKLANMNFEETKAVLEKKIPAPTIKSMLQNGVGAAPGSQTSLTSPDQSEFFKLSKGNPKELERIQLQEPERFKQLQNEYVQLLNA